MENLKEQLDEITRIIQDIRMAQDFKEALENNDNKISMVNFGNGESIFTTLEANVKDQIDDKIAALTEQLKEKVAAIK